MLFPGDLPRKGLCDRATERRDPLQSVRGQGSERGRAPVSGEGGWKRKHELRKHGFFRNGLGFAVVKARHLTTKVRGSCRQRGEPLHRPCRPWGKKLGGAGARTPPAPSAAARPGAAGLPPPTLPGSLRGQPGRYPAPFPDRAGPLRPPQPRTPRRPAPRGGRSLPVCARGRARAGTYLPARPAPAPRARPHVTAGGQSPGAGRGGGRAGGRGALPLPSPPSPRALAPYLPELGGGSGGDRAGRAGPAPSPRPAPPPRLAPPPLPLPRLPLGGGGGGR